MCCVPSRMSLQTREVYAMRDPLLLMHADGDVQPLVGASCPSLSGVAFAAVAAALPLLAGNDVDVNTGEDRHRSASVLRSEQEVFIDCHSCITRAF
jgi:hypothetical protein